MIEKVALSDRYLTWTFSNGAGPNQLGFIVLWFDPRSEKSAQEQANDGYLQTGGCPFLPTKASFTLVEEDGEYRLEHPEDPPMRELARTKIRDETIVLFDYAWMAIIQPDGSHVISRVD